MSHWNPYQPPEDGLSPAEVRLLELRAEPWPENSRRVRVYLQLTPFLERPNIEAVIDDAFGEEVASIHIIESIDATMTFTMHLRGDELKNPYTLKARLSYPEQGEVDQKSVTFETMENNS